MTRTRLRRCSLAPGLLVDLLIEDGRLRSARDDPGAIDSDVDVEGRPVLPGLADHHVHLLATAAARGSVDCSPAALERSGGLGPALVAGRRRHPAGWLRAVGYDVTTSGVIDRAALDRFGIGPVRVQDRTGIFWMLDSAALREVLPEDRGLWPSGVHTDGAGHATGVLERLDGWLGSRVGRSLPDLVELGRFLASRGVTAVTDAGARNGIDELAVLASSGLPQRLTVMTGEVDVGAVPPGVALGAVKILLDDTDLPLLAALESRIVGAHAHGRSVAVHCVSDVQLALALAAGLGSGDRIEHASSVSVGMLGALAEAGCTLVVQPALVHARGDRYLRECEPAEVAGLHRLRSFLDAGIRLAASSDAPYGSADPWDAVRAAVQRTTSGGQPLGPDEALGPVEALGLFLGSSDDPSRGRTLSPGAAADLAVLDSSWGDVTERPDVLATMVAGRVIFGSLDG